MASLQPKLVASSTGGRASQFEGLFARFAGFFALCSISVCSGANVKPGDQDYPQQNPTPKNFLLLHGTIDAALDIDFRVQWHTEKPNCRYATSRLEGAYTWYTAWTPLAISRQGATFSAHIPIDGVLPGRCDWRFGGVTFGGATGYRTGLIATNSYPLKPGQSPNGVAQLYCRWDAVRDSSERTLSCRWPKTEDPNASVLGGTLWWHPEATDLEVHFIAE